LFDGSRSFGGLADWREALFFDCLVREVAGEEADGAVVEGWWGRQGAARAGGVEGVEVAEPGGEGEGGGGCLVAAHGEAVEVGAEEGDLGEGKGEGANLLGAQPMLKSVKVAPSTGSGQAAGVGGASAAHLQVNGSGSWEPPFEEFRAGARAGQAPPLRVYDRITVRVVEQGYVTGRGAIG